MNKQNSCSWECVLLPHFSLEMLRLLVECGKSIYLKYEKDSNSSMLEEREKKINVGKKMFWKYFEEKKGVWWMNE